MSATRRTPWPGLAFMLLLGLGAVLRGPSPAAAQSMPSDAAAMREVALRDGTTFRAEARAGQILTALDDALGRLVRRIDSARKRQMARRQSPRLAFDGR